MPLPGLLIAVGVHKPVYESSGDAHGTGDFRELEHLLRREPSRLAYLFLVDGYLLGSSNGGESDHQGVREGPALAGKVIDFLQLDAALFKDLSGNALLQRLSGLDKARQNAEESLPELRRVGHQQPPFVYHRYDHRRRYARVLAVAAARAVFGDLLPRALLRRTATAAVAALSIPSGELVRPGTYPEGVAAELPERASSVDPAAPLPSGLFIPLEKESVETPLSSAADVKGHLRQCHFREGGKGLRLFTYVDIVTFEEKHLPLSLKVVIPVARVKISWQGNGTPPLR